MPKKALGWDSMLIVFHGGRWHLESKGLLMLESSFFLELPEGSGTVP